MDKLLVSLILFTSSISFSAVDYVELPEQCLAKKIFPCQLKAVSKELELEISGHRLVLEKNTMVEIRSNDQYRLLQGRVWFTPTKSAEGDRILILHSNLKIKFDGEIFVEKVSPETHTVYNLDSNVQIQSELIFQNEVLPIGFQNWYGALATTGQISRGIIRPIDKDLLVRIWTPMSGLSFAEASAKLRILVKSWEKNVDLAAGLYQQVIERRLASQSEKENQAKLRKQKMQDLDAELRALYRQKNGL